MDDSKNGVIYFSMGSNLKSKHFPEELKRKILKMFGGLKQTVLWKFEEVLPDLPSNVHILQWAPQPSILGELYLLLSSKNLDTQISFVTLLPHRLLRLFFFNLAHYNFICSAHSSTFRPKLYFYITWFSSFHIMYCNHTT